MHSVDRMIRHLLILFSLLLSGIAHASTVDTFKASALMIPRRLIQQGTPLIAGIDLRQVLREMKVAVVTSTSWLEHSESEFAGLKLARNSAMWTRTNGDVHIQINEKLWATADQESRSVIALHEHLFSQGYSDQNYVLSIGLWFLSLKQTQAILESTERSGLEDGLQRIAAAKGGATMVGGGGDVQGVHRKMSFLKMHLGHMSHTSNRQQRQKVMKAFVEDFNLTDEVMRTQAGTLSAEIQVSSESTGLIDGCQYALSLSAPALSNFHQVVINTTPSLKQRFPTPKSFSKFCRGYLNGSVKLE